MSSGMKKVLFHIAYLTLSPKGTIFLIDEFENGFGVNCIDAISHWIMNPALKYQFIITSHHPYIIGNLPVRNWIVLHRKGNKVLVKNGSDLENKFSKSKQEAFIQLINNCFYTEGVE